MSDDSLFPYGYVSQDRNLVFEYIILYDSATDIYNYSSSLTDISNGYLKYI